MALTAIDGGLVIPPIACYDVAPPAYASTGLLMDATAEKVAFVFQVPKTGTLDLFEFRLTAVTQAPTNGLSCSFQDVSLTTGDPDGSADQFRVVTAGLTANTWVTPGLITADGTDGGAKRSVTVGDLIACVIGFESFNASDSLTISRFSGASGQIEAPSRYTAYLDHFTAAWAKSTTEDAVIALKYNDGTYAFVNPNWYPISAISTRTYNSGSTPDERGLYFSFPVPVSLGGVSILMDIDGDFDLVLYDTDGTTPLMTKSVDASVRSIASGANAWFRFADVNLTAGGNYRMAIKPTSVTSLSLYEYTVPAAAYLGAVPGGTGWHATSRTDAGAWTQVATDRPWISLLVTKLEAGGSGGAHAYGFA